MKFVPSTGYVTAYTDSPLSAVMPWAAEAIVLCVRNNKRQHQSIICTVNTSKEVRQR